MNEKLMEKSVEKSMKNECKIHEKWMEKSMENERKINRKWMKISLSPANTCSRNTCSRNTCSGVDYSTRALRARAARAERAQRGARSAADFFVFWSIFGMFFYCLGVFFSLKQWKIHWKINWNFRDLKQNQRRAGGKLFGPRKSRCVNFLMQT